MLTVTPRTAFALIVVLLSAGWTNHQPTLSLGAAQLVLPGRGLVHAVIPPECAACCVVARFTKVMTPRDGRLDGHNHEVTRRSASRPTLDEVAARAGVGRGTASRVINGSPQVSAQARAAVEAAITELGYVPNRAARALVTRRTDAVALVVCESAGWVFGAPYLTGVVRGINAVLMRTSLRLWLTLAATDEQRQRVADQLTDQQVDGVLLLSLHDDEPLPDVLRARQLPLVLGGRPARLARGDAFVDVDQIAAARAAVAFLHSLGAHRIVTVAGPPDTAVGRDRVAGYRSAVNGPALIGYADFTADGGAKAMRALLEREPELDAVLAASDVMASGALQALQAAGRQVPGDVAVIGIEDAPTPRVNEPGPPEPGPPEPGPPEPGPPEPGPPEPGPPELGLPKPGQPALIMPGLTTVRLPVEEIGRRMAELLIELISGRVVDSQILLDTQLVRRGSA